MYLAIDFGSTCFKAAVFNADLARRGHGAYRLRYQYPVPGHVELPVREVADGIRACLAQALAAAGPAARSIRAIAVTSQAQTFTIADRAGTPRMPFISWQDTRAAETCDAMKRQPEWRTFREHCSFGQLIPALQVCLLRHMQTREKTERDPRDRLMPLSSYAVWLLSGQYCLDRNLAAMHGLYSLASRDWWADALAACGLARRQLPRLHEAGAAAAMTSAAAEAFGLPREIPIVLAGNDQTAGAYGAGLHETEAALLTLGTAYVVYAVRRTLPRAAKESVRGSYPGGRYYRLAADSSGGNVIAWATHRLMERPDYDAFFETARRAPAARNGLVFQPGAAGSAGEWRHIRPRHTKADLAASVLDALAARVRRMVHRVNGRGAKMLLAGGGGSAQPAWLEWLADALGMPVVRTEADALLGAARMAREAVGENDE